MSLVLLYRPTVQVVVVPPPTPAVVPQGAGHNRVKPPPELRVFPASTARISLLAFQPSLLLQPQIERGKIKFRHPFPVWEMRLLSPANRRTVIYRAVRDERMDEDFHELVKTAYLMTR